MREAAIPLQTPAVLGKALDDIMRALEGDIALIAKELDNPLHFDTAKVMLALGRITQLSHKFIQFLPKISAARAAFLDVHGQLSPVDAHRWGELNTRAYRTRTWVNQWPHIERLVRAQTPPKRRKLFVKPDEISIAQNKATNAVMDGLHAILNTSGQDEAARAHGCFADITLPHSTFMALLHAACRVTLAQKMRHPPRFLDVGCGGGMKVLSARQFFERSDGLEYDPGYVAASNALFDRSKTGGCRVIHADGLTFEGYNQYDVIYFYRPMRDIDMLRALERQIIETARPGTLIIAPYKMFDYRYQEMGCAHLADRLYITGMSQREATALRRKSELIGPDPNLAKLAAPSIWDSVLTASRRNGFSAEI